jgi:hypothetical protein
MSKVPTTHIRTPVRRHRAEFYILLTLLSFAASVSITRVFLQLTGFPKIGSGELHIAHVLWGGLILFIAALLPLIFANRWVYTYDAILAGIGVGLFIDEVGKFITQSNNYFYPAAAPIIYAIFLLTVLLYTQVRRRHNRDARTELYTVLDDLEEVLDNDLSEKEKAELVSRLEYISKETDREDFAKLAKSLDEFITSDRLVLVPEQPGFMARQQSRIQAQIDRWLTRRRLIAGLIGGLIALGVWALSYPIQVFFAAGSQELQNIVTALVSNQILRGDFSLVSFQLRLAMEVSTGFLLITGATLLAIGKIRRGINLSYIVLLVSLAVVDLLVFYFDQFTTIINAVVQLILLLGILYFRRHFLDKQI